MKRQWLALALAVTMGMTAGPVANAETTAPTDFARQAIDSIFGGETPQGYAIGQSGALKADDRSEGYYLRLTPTDASHSRALLLDVRKAGKEEGRTLRKANLEALAQLLYRQYYGPAYTVGVRERDKIDLLKNSGDYGLAHLSVTPPDGSNMPGIVLRLEYPHDRTVVMLLDRPGHSGDNKLSDTFSRMESEAQDLVGQTTLSEKLLPSERYILWRLREIFF